MDWWDGFIRLFLLFLCTLSWVSFQLFVCMLSCTIVFECNVQMSEITKFDSVISFKMYNRIDYFVAILALTPV